MFTICQILLEIPNPRLAPGHLPSLARPHASLKLPGAQLTPWLPAPNVRLQERPAGKATHQAQLATSPPMLPAAPTLPPKVSKGRSQAAGRQLTSRPPAALLEPARGLERKENARPLGTEPATPCRPYGSPSTHAGSGGTRSRGHLDMNPARDARSWSLCAARTGTKTRL